MCHSYILGLLQSTYILTVLLIFFNLKKYYTLLILILKRLGYVQVKAHAKNNLWRNHKIRGRGEPKYMWNGH